jgi:hypothetical protein
MLNKLAEKALHIMESCKLLHSSWSCSVDQCLRTLSATASVYSNANESSCVIVDAEDKFHRNPLVVSVWERGYTFAKLLLEAGADIKKCIPIIHDLNALSHPVTNLLDH